MSAQNENTAPPSKTEILMAKEALSEKLLGKEGCHGVGKRTTEGFVYIVVQDAKSSGLQKILETNYPGNRIRNIPIQVFEGPKFRTL